MTGNKETIKMKLTVMVQGEMFTRGSIYHLDPRDARYFINNGFADHTDAPQNRQTK